MKVLILVNGTLEQPDILRRRIDAEAFGMVVAADGAAGHADALGVGVDAIIGDLDSLPQSDQLRFGGTEFVFHPPEKDETDLELALLYAWEQGADSIVLVAVLGGRMDMAIANVMLLAHARLASCRMEIWHGEQTAWVIRPPGEDILREPGDTLSLIPLGGEASGITTSGLKYPLENGRLPSGAARGISNVMETTAVHVDLSEGLLLAVHTPGEA